MADQPYLSVVVAARNDNYGGDFEQRLQNCVNWFCYYANRYKLNAEILIVNYNPVSERPQLKEAIQFPASNCVRFRIITVPNSFHEKVANDPVRKKLPFYEYIAKNIGIRRAKGEFILAANPDILIDPAIIENIANCKLNAQSYYRVNRADYEAGMNSINPATDLEKIRSRVFRLFLKGFTYTLKPGSFTYFKTALLYLKNRLRLFYEFQILPFEKLVNKFNIQIKPNNVEFKMHCNCSGDFIMMHKDAWNKLKGHPERLYHPMHTDAFTVATAFFSGLHEKVFFNPVYHQDHGRRFTADNSDPDIFAAYMKFENDGREMEKSGKAIIYNDDNWGFISEKFTDEIMTAV